MVLVIILGFLGTVLLRKDTVAGAISPTDVSATNFTEITASVGAQLATLFLGGVTADTSIGEQVSTGSCASATTTIFAVANPFSATSTVRLQSFKGIGNATTTLLYVGTSTASTGLALTNVSPTLVNAASVATSTQFITSSGITVGSLGYLSSGSGTFPTISVGPSDYIVAFATTTATGAGAANYSGTYSSCVYKLRWAN